MTRQNTADQNDQVQSLVARLAEAVGRIEGDDLSGLAQMHGWCEALIELASSSDSGLAAQLTDRVPALARALEALILGDTTDTAQALAGMAATIQELAAAASPQAGPAEDKVSAPSFETEAANPFQNLTTEEVSDRLAQVFDEPEEPVSPPAAVEPDSSQELNRVADAGFQSQAPAPAAYVSEPLIIDAKELDFVKGFVEEAREHIEAIETAVLEVERCPGDTAKIDDLFRPFHTIKGMAGFLNLRDINSLTHEVETLLDHGRKGKRAVTAGVIDIVLSVVDVLKTQVNGVGQWVAEPSSQPVAQPPVSDIIDRLRAVVSGQLDPDADTAGDRAAKPAAAVPVAAAPVAAENTTSSAASATPAATDTADAKAGSSSTTQAGAKVSDQSIRIDTEKLDALIDMVGELVIAQTLVNLSDDVIANPKLGKNVTQVTKIVRDVQELAMSMRMVPIGPTFQKMARLVRDVSRKAGKQVNLTISGEDTELDKTVIQEIGDPLVHMVRNAVDHGVEAPDARRAAGKSETGQVHLHAGHEGGNIVISIRDDGKGLDPAVLVAKAVEKGMIEPGTELTDQQAFGLIFAPGFSTAAQVTDISGRGVGMDVVKRNLEQLRGRVEISSEKGNGTTFTIRLPLTLAIIDGMIVRVGRERFILPTITIQQSLRPQRSAITTVHHRGEVLNVRGELIPLIQLGELFGLTGRIDPCEAMVIIAHCEGRLVGLVVEELIGQQQVVIKTLGERFERLSGISGAAILGDGRVGLILEMTGLNAAYDAFTRMSQFETDPRVGTQDDFSPQDLVPENQPGRQPAAELACR